MATKEEVRCTIKVESTIKVKVHGRGPRQGAASPKLEKPPSKQDGGLALLRRDVSHGDVAFGG